MSNWRSGPIPTCSMLILVAGSFTASVHADTFLNNGVTAHRGNSGEFPENTIPAFRRAYQLLHVLLHELGHHHDRMTTKRKQQASRGEAYAERYANHYASTTWERYWEEFGLP